MMATATETLLLCRCCNKPLKVDPQQNWKGEWNLLLTCKTNGCAMQAQTLDERDYATEDLSKYKAEQHPEWEG